MPEDKRIILVCDGCEKELKELFPVERILTSYRLFGLNNTRTICDDCYTAAIRVEKEGEVGHAHI